MVGEAIAGAGMIGRVPPALDIAQSVVAEAIAGGVTDVVLCPGSRSAPLAYAALAAEQAGHLRLHVRVDERSAGFLALGLAKLTRCPAVVITTSGTAVANLHPAVLEAHHAHVPLVVVTADRPAALRGTGANQTTIQPGIFAGAVRLEIDLPVEATPTSARAATADAVSTSRGSTGPLGADPGPVHLNVCLGEPLVPDAWPPPAGPRSRPAEESRPIPPHDGSGLADGRPASASAGGVAEQLPHVPRTLVVLGDLVDARDRVAVASWAARRGYPLIAEPFGLRRGGDGALPHGPLILTCPDWLDAHAPDRVLVVGRVTLSRPVTQLLRRDGVRVEAVTDTRWTPDPVQVVSTSHPLGALRAELAGPAGSREPARPPSQESDDGSAAWAAGWLLAGARVAATVADITSEWGSGIAVARAVAEALPPGAVLFVGPSNPVRDLDFGAVAVAQDVTIVANRGLAGIDGCLSSAIGIALARRSTGKGASPGLATATEPLDPDRATYALVGDLTFLHDANGLLLGPAEEQPELTIIVVNDDGGGIFTLLEPGAPERQSAFERIFGTPTRTDLGALCRAHGIPHQRVESTAHLTAAVVARPRGIRVVEVVIDRAGHRAAHQRLRDAAALALR